MHFEMRNSMPTFTGKIFGSSARLFRVNGHLLPYAWNHTIVYNTDTYDRMPHLVQRLVVRMPSADYNTNQQVRGYVTYTFPRRGKCSLEFNFTISLMADSLSLNSANYKIHTNLLMIACMYMDELQKS